MQSKIFHNWSDRQFKGTYNKEDYFFEPGQKMALPDYLANHFAKHLTNREMILANFNTDDHRRDSFLEKCFVSADAQPEMSEAKAVVHALNAEVEQPAKKSPGRPKKDPTNLLDDQSFEGLKK